MCVIGVKYNNSGIKILILAFKINENRQKFSLNIKITPEWPKNLLSITH